MSRMVRRGRSYKAMQATGAGGRFVRNTLENTVGLRMIVCPHCRICNTYAPDEAALNDRFPIVRWIAPTHCHACGQPLTGATPAQLLGEKFPPGTTPAEMLRQQEDER